MVDKKPPSKNINSDENGVDFIISSVNEEETVECTTTLNTPFYDQQELPTLPRPRRSGRNRSHPSTLPQYESKDNSTLRPPRHRVGGGMAMSQDTSGLVKILKFNLF